MFDRCDNIILPALKKYITIWHTGETGKRQGKGNDKSAWNGICFTGNWCFKEDKLRKLRQICYYLMTFEWNKARLLQYFIHTEAYFINLFNCLLKTKTQLLNQIYLFVVLNFSLQCFTLLQWNIKQQESQ